MRLIFVVLIFLSSLFAKNILILNSYSIQLAWTKSELEGILSVLKNHKEVKKYIEFMDTKIFRPTPMRMYNYYYYLFNKYKNIRFDIIMTTDDNALNFVRKYKNYPLFKNAKVFFCGVNNLSLAKKLDKSVYTGVFEKKEPMENLKFAKKIKSDLKYVYIVSDASVSGTLVVKQYLEAFKNVKNIKFIVINEQDLDNVLNKLKNYRENSVMMLLTPSSYYQKGKHVNYILASQLISKNYNNPMIVHTDILVNIPKTNIVGGKVTDGLSQGWEVAKKVITYLKGTPVKDIPFTFEKANKMYLNVKNLEKFGIDAYSLGYKNAIYVNKPTSFWEIYKEWIIAFLIILFLIILFIIVLAVKNRQLKHYNQQIEELNSSLEERVKKAVAEISKKDQILAHQTRLAALGEMIGAIAHQWRQPLNTLAINLQMLPELIEEFGCDEEKIEEFVEKNMKTIFFMSETIDDFRNFFRDDNKKIDFSIKEAVEDTLKLINAQLKSKKIEVEIKGDDFTVFGSKNQFQQVLLNLISNAKDAIEENNVKNGKITVEIDSENKKVVIMDNGGGVDEKIMYKIFDPYFTTKELKGSGIGLYMSKTIIEKYFNGKLMVSNIENGAKFTISFNK
jgi:signal transduction histidine kinase/vacuolar-type H+-ATPase subunit F/Vma7